MSQKIRFSAVSLFVASLTLAASSALACDCEAMDHKAQMRQHESGVLPKARANETVSGTRTAALQVKGMMCIGCDEKVFGALCKLPGVKAVHIERKKDNVTVNYLPEQVHPEAMLKAVDAVGFKATAN